MANEPGKNYDPEKKTNLIFFGFKTVCSLTNNYIDRHCHPENHLAKTIRSNLFFIIRKFGRKTVHTDVTCSESQTPKTENTNFVSFVCAFLMLRVTFV